MPAGCEIKFALSHEKGFTKSTALPSAVCTGETALIKACADGDVAAVGLHLGQGTGLNEADSGGWTPLMTAVVRGNTSCARLLLEHDAKVDLINGSGVTALILACIADSRECAVLLCSYGASRSVTNKFGRSAAYFARQNDEALARWLEQTHQYVTPLHYLDDLTPLRTRALLEAGASIHARAAPDAPSSLDIARDLERGGSAPAGSPAAIVLAWWRERLQALAMGTHSRLGRGSPLRHLGGIPEVLELIAQHWAAKDGDGLVTQTPKGDAAMRDVVVRFDSRPDTPPQQSRKCSQWAAEREARNELF